MHATRDRQPHGSLLCLALILLAVFVRGGVLVAQHDRLTADPDGYRTLAQNLVEHGVMGRGTQPSAYRPPLYPIVLAACVAGPWKSETAIGLVHFALGLLTVASTVSLAKRWGLGAFSYLAGGLVACDPILVNQSTLVMTETLATLLAVVSLAFISPAIECAGRRRVVLAALAGASFALAALCRPTFLLSLVLTVLALAWLLPDWRQRWQGVATVTIAAACVLLPWAVRNAYQLGKPIVATTHGGYTLLLGNNPEYYAFLRTAPWRAVWHAEGLDESLSASRSADEVSNDRDEYDLAWQTIRQQPGMFAYASLLRLGALWGVLPHRTTEDESLSRQFSRYAVGAWYLAVFGLALVAVVSGEARLARAPWLFATALAAGFTLAHLVYWTDMRMRAPLVPAISLLAAAGVKSLPFRQARRRSAATNSGREAPSSHPLDDYQKT
ncbi:MAG TPA: glycosyltransferase family 39 protein [Pirellulales bacterium]|jgi:4-amino-4-deoxy-L-arabinose transferase-like glycosyltransferase|nr:glycosyltransferase family 39 protein [Pirellulales bacterium]